MHGKLCTSTDDDVVVVMSHNPVIACGVLNGHETFPVEAVAFVDLPYLEVVVVHHRCDDSLDEDLSETAESLHTQIALTSVVHSPPTRTLPTSLAFARRLGKEILMPLGYRAAMDRWRAAPPSTCHLLLPSEIPSSSSLPLSLLPSLSLPSPSLLPSLSRKRSISPSPSPPPLVTPLPLPPPPPVPPPQERIELVRDDIETLYASLASAIQETVTFYARGGLLEQHDVEVRELREFRMTDRLKIIELRSRSENAESCLEKSHERQTGYEACMTDMIEQDIETLLTRVEAVEQQAEPLQIIAQRVANAIETIAIYETKIRMARDLMTQVECQEDKMAENASNKRKWKGDHGGSSSQNKGHNVIKSHAFGPSNKKVYAGKLPYYNRCKLHNTGPCFVQCSSCKRISH
ncbi:hypothetical protein Tco_1272916 [Tanacetum coccineum]